MKIFRGRNQRCQLAAARELLRILLIEDEKLVVRLWVCCTIDVCAFV